jgi:hypothetical protein
MMLRKKIHQLNMMMCADGLKNIILEKQILRGYNSFIADHPKQEYQIDLFFMNEDEQYKVGLLIIDIFSKFIDVQPLKTKQPDDILQGLKDGFQNMQGKPESIYSVMMKVHFNSKLLQDYFKEHNINHIVTRGHAPYAERGIRTIKNLIYKRLEKNPDSNWHDSKILANALSNL